MVSPARVAREPERMYKIVLAGDAAVGKSSFIVRLCKGKFVPNLSSTLGQFLVFNIFKKLCYLLCGNDIYIWNFIDMSLYNE